MGGTRTVIGVIAAVVVAAVAFTGALLYGSGGLSKLMPAEPVVKAGAYKFTYPESWQRMAPSKLPARSGTHSSGDVVAGLCPAGGSGKKCAAGLGVSYVLFQEGATFPALATLERQFDASFAKSYAGFEKVAAKEHEAADGTPYLRYEFHFEVDGRARRGIVAAYRAGRSDGVVVVAKGPQRSFEAHRDEILTLLDGAHE